MKQLPIIFLAPSEDKAVGGKAGTLSETPEQRWVREHLIELVVHGSAEAQKKAFDVKDAALEKAKRDAIALKASVPLLPALQRYQGVAFESLDAASLSKAHWKQVFILSNLRGLVRGDEAIPAYKLKLTGLPGLKSHWQKALKPALEKIPQGIVWELLPKEHADFLKGWDRPRHSLEIVDARGKTISHWSKLYRGLVARWILEHQQGDPKKVLKAKIDGCHWDGAEPNALGGAHLRLVVP
jgi:uncharacterized protein